MPSSVPFPFCAFPARILRRAAACVTFLVLGAPAALGSAATAWAAPLWDVPAEVSQGRAFVVRATDTAPFTAAVVWRNKTIPLAVAEGPTPGVWEGRAMLAVPIDAKGALELTLRDDEGSRPVKVAALSVPWHEDHLTVAPKYVTPPAEVQAQIKRDGEHNAKVLAALRPGAEWTLPLYRPVKGSISGPFGGRRVFNGQPRAPHKGTDMRGPTGTPAHAVAAGTVVLAEPQYYSGNVIMVDHGQGVISMYGHLSAFDVKVGDRVERGQIIGRVGATGRVTGPHLHLGLLVQGVAVDAMPLYVEPLQVVGGPTPEDKIVRPAPQNKAAASGPAGS